MAHVRLARAAPTSDANIALLLILAEEKDTVWRRLFDDALPPVEPYDLSERVVTHGARTDGLAIFAELTVGASEEEEAVLRTLDWLNDTANATDQAHAHYSAVLKRANSHTARWLASHVD
jgi:hypothetical protein